MHSYDSMLKEVEEKLALVQEALHACERERSRLSSNLNSIKESVDQSFQRHIGTLQCRAKWLVCHADSIYHLKEGSLSQQIAELELMSNELKSCLDFDLSNNDEEMKFEAKNVLQNALHVSLQPCESGSMCFVGNDNRLEEMIIGFGDIDAHESSMVECEADEGIFVVESPTQPDSIEMKVKSIEMHHLTAQSANSEKEDFERIEMDTLDSSAVNLGKDKITHPSQGDSGVEEGTESNESIEWLHRPTTSDQVVPDKTVPDFKLFNNIKLEEDSNNFVTSANKVPLWLKKCEEPNPWIHHTTLKSTSHSKESSFDNHNVPVTSQMGKSMNSITELNVPGGCTTIDHMNNIYLTSNSKFLQRYTEGIDTSVNLLDGDVSFLSLQEGKELQHPENELSRSHSNISQFNDIYGADNSMYLQGLAPNINSDLPPFNSEKSLKNEGSLSSFYQGKLSNLACQSSTDESNVSNLKRILDAEANTFLLPRNTNNEVPRNPPVSASPVDHMRNIESMPDKMFLCPGVNVKKLDATLCEWLRGSATVETCSQCIDFDDCEFNGRLDSKWVKTATDW